MRESRQGRWYETGAARNIIPDTSRGQVVAWGVEAGDVDNDADLDVFVAFGQFPPDRPDSDVSGNPALQPDAMYRNVDGTFIDVAGAWGVADLGRSRGVGLVDLDSDGRLDLLVRESDGPLRGYTAGCGPERGVVVSLHQPGPNPRAIGARVTLHSGAHVQTRWLRSGGTGHGTFTPVVAHFGVGDADTIDRVDVVWPDGHTESATDVPVRPNWSVERSHAH